MNENDQNAQELLLQAQESLSESVTVSSQGDPVSGSYIDNTASDEMVTEPDAEDIYTGEVLSGTVEDPASVEDTQPSDISFNVALLFVISMVLGIQLFSILSRKWHA